jgi:hypothetical protein
MPLSHFIHCVNVDVTLGGDLTDVDTPLEIALWSIAPGVAEIRPAEANRMLGTPRQADLKLGTAVFQEIQVLRFFGDTAAVSRHEAMLQFIVNPGNVTRTEVEAFYCGGIMGLISGIVDEEVAKRQPINPAFVAEIKQILTNFLLNPTRESHNILYQKQRQYASTDGQRGINSSDVLMAVIYNFNLELGDTVIDPSRLI